MLTRLDHDLTQEDLSALQLDRRGAILLLVEVPVEVVGVVEVRIRRPSAQDAVRMTLEPAPEPIEREGRPGLDRDGHGREYTARHPGRWA